MGTGERASGGRRCPHCGGERIARIVYGFPSEALEADARAGRVVLGGCNVHGGEPTRRCRSCGHEWRPGAPGAAPGSDEG